MVSKAVARTPPPTHAGGQDDGSYTNSLKKVGKKNRGLRRLENIDLGLKKLRCGCSVGRWVGWKVGWGMFGGMVARVVGWSVGRLVSGWLDCVVR